MTTENHDACPTTSIQHVIDLTTTQTPPHAIWLEQLDLHFARNEWGAVNAGRSLTGSPIRLADTTYPHGVGTHARTEIHVNLRGAVKRFVADVGIDMASDGEGWLRFAVIVDDKEVTLSPVIHRGNAPHHIDIDLTGAQRMTLVVRDTGFWNTANHADWAGALLVLDPAKSQLPCTYQPPRPVPTIHIGSSPQPEIHGPLAVGATPKHAFLYRVPATGQRPLRFEAANLPEGLLLDAATGIITGSLQTKGVTVVDLTASNTFGQGQRKLIIVGGEGVLALTPPMGWNSWNVWGTEVNASHVRNAADAMIRSGLADHGYQYINVDDAWEGERDSEGRIRTNHKFPDMAALGASIHVMGLKFGIYSSPGRQTCGEYEGSYGYELLDAQTWAAWGVDYLKYDWCYYRLIYHERMNAWKAANPDATDDQRKQVELAEHMRPYQVMRAALDQVDRDIVYSLCQYGDAEVWRWGNDPAVRAEVWRTTGDIRDEWASFSDIGFKQAPLHPFARPGHWNDPDMLVVGRLGWGNVQDCHLTPIEQVTHISLWCLLSAPLLIGCDMTQMDDFTRAVLTNDEVIAVNQDPLGQQGRPVQQNETAEVWVKPLWDGTIAVGLFNRGSTEAEVTADFATLGFNGEQPVRDLWKAENLGLHRDRIAKTVPAHGSVLLKIGTPNEHDAAIARLVKLYQDMIHREAIQP